MSARISACLVLYNSGDEALEALRCLDREAEEIEVHVVDNSPGSKLADDIRWQYPGIHYHPMEKNLGFGKGNNVVLSELTSDYHLLINPDITFERGTLEKMIEWMDKPENERVAVLTPHVLNPNGTTQYLPKYLPTVRYLLSGFLEGLPGPFAAWRKEYTMAAKADEGPYSVMFATGCFLLIRTRAFKHLKGFDERFFLYQEDSDLSRRVTMQEGQIKYHPDFKVTHAWARENKRSLRGIRRQVTSICKYFAKWGVTWK